MMKKCVGGVLEVSGVRKQTPWCLWCLSRPEIGIGVTYAERLKRLQRARVVEIANIHAIFVHVAENIVGCGKDPSEYPTLSAISFSGLEPF
jgi:hypothetical protein